MRACRSFLVLLFVLLLQSCSQKEIEQEAGVLAPEEPLQVNIKKPEFIQRDEYKIWKKASYKGRFRILSREDYSSDRESDLSPTDLALGWKRMSDSAVLDHFDISQRGRWFTWHSDRLPIPMDEAVLNAANTHIIPANDRVAELVDDLCKGQVIELSGFLVNVDSNDGWHWRSSMSRHDRGGGSCEIVFVENLKVIQ